MLRYYEEFRGGLRCRYREILHLLTAGFGPNRQLAAVQRFGRYRWKTGRSVDAAKPLIFLKPLILTRIPA